VPDFEDGRMTMSGLAVIDPGERDVLTLRSERASGGRAVKCYSERCSAPPAWTVAAPPPASTRGSGAASVQLPERGGSMTTAREFRTGQTMQVGFELYDNRRPRRGSTGEGITVTAALVSFGGKVFPLASDARAAGSGSGGIHRFVLPLALTNIPPGQYALRVRASPRDGADADVSHDIRILVR
jgi:hypothetical protein